MKTSKKSVMLAIAIVLTFGCRLYAQQEVKPTPKVEKTFNFNFKNATQVNWQKQRSSFVATFSNGDAYAIAFIDDDGNLFAEGTKVLSENLPLKVKDRAQLMREGYEEKYGPLQFGMIFKVTNQDYKQEYYFPLENETHSMLIITDRWGNNAVVKKDEQKVNVMELDQKKAVTLIH